MAQVGGGSAAHAHAPRVLGELLVQHLQRRRREEFGESVNSGVETFSCCVREISVQLLKGGPVGWKGSERGRVGRSQKVLWKRAYCTCPACAQRTPDAAPAQEERGAGDGRESVTQVWRLAQGF